MVSRWADPVRVGQERHDFDLERVHTALVECQHTPSDVILKEYLAAYHELCRFFKLTGRLFGFVAKDLEGKISVLEEKLTGDQSEFYQTVQSMVEHEVTHDLVSRTKRVPSGSRTLLRLHWALEFILEFMSRVQASSANDNVAVLAWEVYSETLSHHHPWITRQMAHVAVHFLPSIGELISTMCKHDLDMVLDLLQDVVTEGRHVYNLVEETLSRHDLLNLP